MTTAPLIDLIDERLKLLDGIMAACAARKHRRLTKLSQAARKGVLTRHSNRMAGLVPVLTEGRAA